MRLQGGSRLLHALPVQQLQDSGVIFHRGAGHGEGARTGGGDAPQAAGLLDDGQEGAADGIQVHQMVDGLQAAYYPTATVEQIIREELAPYLAGDTSEEEATQKIQSRVYLYLQEQYQ